MRRYLVLTALFVGLLSQAFAAPAEFVIVRAYTVGDSTKKCTVISARRIIGSGYPATEFRIGDIYPTEAEAGKAMAEFPECK
jgi:hypothetical protein